MCSSIPGDIRFNYRVYPDTIPDNCLQDVGNVRIANSTAVRDVDALSLLTTATGVSISNNDNLVNVDGLASLTSLDVGLYISENDALTSLDGLASLTSLGDVLYIADNSALCQSLVDAFIDRLQGLGWSGTAETANNGDC